ncbi:MAG: hypothetical protein MI922_27445, partial [Bacteroidales bacterium]|nr:hypothetical protein [Bacteroidales bacterium]
MKPIQLIFLAMLSLAMINCSKDGEIGPQGLQGEIGPAGKNGSVMHAGEGVPSESTGVFGDYYLDKLTHQLYGPKTDGIGWGVPIVLKGEKGDTGSAGSQIYAGITLPSSTLGTVGDFYLNKSTYDLYGPKQESGWGSPLNLKGMPDIIYSA